MKKRVSIKLVRVVFSMLVLLCGIILANVVYAYAATPCIFNSTESASPGDVIGLQGYDFGTSPQVLVTQVGTSSVDVVATILSKSSIDVSATIPSTLTFGLYSVRIKNGTIYSNVIYINRARAHTLEFDEVAIGNSFRIFGRNLYIAGGTPTVKFINGGNTYNATVDTANSSSYVLKVTAPSGLTSGTVYTINVYNGYGGTTLGKVAAAETIKGRSTGSDTWSLGVPWAADFTFSGTIHNVKTDPNISPHAVGDGTTNDRDAIQAAIDYSNTHGGGVVYLPTGTYKLDYAGSSLPSTNLLTMRSNVVLKGDGMTYTTLKYGYTTPPSSGSYDGYAVYFDQNTTTSGMVDLKTQNVNGSIHTNNLRNNMGNVSKIFFQRCYMDFGTNSGGFVFKCINKFLLSNSTITAINGAGSYVFYIENCTYSTIRGNTLQYANRRLNAGSIKHVVIENNHFTRDGDHHGTDGEFGGLEVDCAKQLSLLGNTFDVCGAPIIQHNDGETILSQSIGTFRSLGTATAGSSNTLTDTTKNWSTIPSDCMVAITEGTGAGQWRWITSNTSTQVTVSSAWGIIPDSTSKYKIGIWDADRWIVKDNVLTGCDRGIWIYQGGTDLAIVNNQLTNSDEIYLRSDQRYGTDRYALVWNALVADNTLVDNNNKHPAAINVSVVYVDGTELWGTGVLGVEIRHNSVDANLPNYSGEGYYSDVGLVSPTTADNDTAGVLGTIFQDNTATDTDYAYHVSTGSNQIVLWNCHNNNIGSLIQDVTSSGGTHASIDTVVGPTSMYFEVENLTTTPITAGPITATCDVLNTYTSSKTITIILAFCNASGIAIKIATQERTIATNATATSTNAVIDLTGKDVTGGKLKMFVWDDLINMIPLVIPLTVSN